MQAAVLLIESKENKNSKIFARKEILKLKCYCNWNTYKDRFL